VTKMRLPTVEGRTNYHPKKALCPWCRKHKVLEPHSFAWLAGGALLIDRKTDSGRTDENTDVYLDIGWHGAHDEGEGKDRDAHVTVKLAEDVRGGCYELYFCSTLCLRSYLNFCVDELEKRVKKQLRELAKPRSRRRR